MPFLNSIARLVKDPPPNYLFELSEAGIAFAQGGRTGFQPFEPGTLIASPIEDNLHRPDVIGRLIDKIAPQNGGSKKRRPAAVILPDYAARVSVLDFDSFPAAPEEQLPLIKFRVKKTIPFDIDSAAVSYHIQQGGKKNVEVVAVTVALEIIARYEALFRNAGFQPGEVTTSALAALNLYEGEGVAVVAKLAGHVLSVMVLAGDVLKLFRCVTLEEVTEDEILAVLHPTFAYVEDELGLPARKLILCGFPQGSLSHLNYEIELLQSRFGRPEPFNAGLFGYLEANGN
jgi:type IV pilus assembly protein PilM